MSHFAEKTFKRLPFRTFFYVDLINASAELSGGRPSPVDQPARRHLASSWSALGSMCSYGLELASAG